MYMMASRDIARKVARDGGHCRLNPRLGNEEEFYHVQKTASRCDSKLKTPLSISNGV
jgi:hypothetical protein